MENDDKLWIFFRVLHFQTANHIELVHGVNLNQQTFHWGAAPPRG